MKPYYDDGRGITIYHGDCREILPTLAKADLLLTDPPYGIGYSARKAANIRREYSSKSYAGGSSVVGDSEAFNPSVILGCGSRAILWGASHYCTTLPTGGRWLVWDKRGGNPEFYGTNSYSDCELAWDSKDGPDRMYRQIWNGIVRQGESVARKGFSRFHPTEKPVELMRWCLSLAEDCKSIIDPYMGSGTTLRASKDLDRHAIGIEIEECYCEIAVKRLAQEVLQFT